MSIFLIDLYFLLKIAQVWKQRSCSSRENMGGFYFRRVVKLYMYLIGVYLK